MSEQISFLDKPEYALPDISGLFYKENYITSDDHDFLLKEIDKMPWLSDLKRRVQHYGYKYDYKARNIDQTAYLGDLPKWLDGLCRKLVDDGIFQVRPDQVIINEYLPGQGISAHIDCTPCFKDVIVSLSLGSSCIMELSNPDAEEKQKIYLEPCSIIRLADDARYVWQHAIPARKSDTVDGQKRLRSRRVSLTFRNVVLSD